MRIRQLIIRLVAVAGIVASTGGFLYAYAAEDMFVGSVWMILGVGMMASSAVYSLAMDDAEARLKALTTNRHHTSIDLRDPIDLVHDVDTRTRVSV